MQTTRTAEPATDVAFVLNSPLSLTYHELRAYVHPDDWPRIDAVFDKRKAGCEHECRRFDGQRIEVFIDGSQIETRVMFDWPNCPLVDRWQIAMCSGGVGGDAFVIDDAVSD